MEPRESKTVEIAFDEYSFRYVDIKLDYFAVQNGNYQIMLGSSSIDIRLSGMLYINGIESTYGDINDSITEILYKACRRHTIHYIRQGKVEKFYFSTVP